MYILWTIQHVQLKDIQGGISHKQNKQNNLLNHLCVVSHKKEFPINMIKEFLNHLHNMYMYVFDNPILGKFLQHVIFHHVHWGSGES